ncbi:MAG TPA: SPOR domain-containing protein [Verrucomicrobiae bacterium]|nr:SPOR domain-containing protein [Verrucomicrobiae bacterium]
MDDALRRRLVGAVVLLALAFVVASLLPDPHRARSPSGEHITYDLRTGVAVGGIESAMPPEAAPSELSPAPRPTLKVDDTLGVAPGAWYLQIGSFESQSNARKVLQTLYGAGLPAVIHSVTSGKKLWYRVRVGPYTDEGAAKLGLEEVRKHGYPLAQVVQPETSATTAAPGTR